MTNIDKLNNIYDHTSILIKNKNYENIEKLLNEISDIERLMRKITLGIIQPYEMYDFIISYQNIKKIIKLLKDKKEFKTLLPKKNFRELVKNFITDVDAIFNYDELKK